ncbi:4Fe-4S single cluster domain-containing protein [Moorella sp. E308F]|uniref:4Fe-4S single cluster domain-containing protein n=1 Tax=Moorella sp. E308F TaxID=2572682 RepID=UPI001C0EA5F6|nr:4Fe-4S single cluster domain-containing protein [Moorella sp. E308F]
MSTIDTDGIAFSIFFQGCRRRCPGCHNPELQPFEGGQQLNTEDIITKITKHLDWYDAVCFLGGEPLEQPEALTDLLDKSKDLGLERWLYTGYEVKDIPAKIYNLCSVIVAGEFRQDLFTGGFPASLNQMVIDRRV